jgi:4-hydroxybenzoate polyprenyltransferase
MWAERLKNFGSKAFRILLYSNAWIALAALALSWQTEFLLLGKISLRPLHGFLFFGTVFIYASHRLVSLNRMPQGDWQERFFYISRGQRWIYAYAALSLLIAGFFYFWLSPKTRLLTLVPGVLSLAYVFPVLRGGKRIRDVHFLKIFLIALVWGWMTVVLPAADLSLGGFFAIWPMSIERVCFIFAITLPFDVRDLLLDNTQSVKTLPGLIGMRATRILAGVLLFIMALMVGLSAWWHWYTSAQLFVLLISAILAMYLVYKAHPEQPDVYFTGWLDGTMILQFLLVLIVS